MSRQEGTAGGARPRASKGDQRATAPAAGPLPTLALPKGGGAIRGIGEKLTTNPATGTGTLAVPIATTPGRGGFELGLQLGYDSGAGNGGFGLGWSVALPAVTRKTDKGIPRYDGDDVFVLAGSEDLVPVGGADEGAHRVDRFQPRTEGGFAHIERWTRHADGDAHWQVVTRDGVLQIFGRTAGARIADPDQPARVFTWLLEETRDDRGNAVRYQYKAEDGAGVDQRALPEAHRFDARGGYRATAQRYPKRIWYGNRAPVLERTAPLPDDAGAYCFEVVFDHGEHDDAAPTPDEVRPWPARRDAFSVYRAGFEVRTVRLCRRVLVFHRFPELGDAPCLVRSTDLAHDEGPAITYLASITQAGYQRGPDGRYQRAALPPLALGYQRPTWQDELRTIGRDSLDGIRGGIEGSGAQWVDLDGEGLAGVLIPAERGWLYKANRGEGQLAPPVALRSLPSPAELGSGGQQLTDLDGDGRLELVSYAPPLAGYFARTPGRDWAGFVALRDLPDLDWNDPDLKFIDLDGDGLADVLITEDEAFVWHRSRGRDGFGPAARIGKPTDEREGPALVFADGTQSIFVADLSGDGLADLVRVRNGEVCYWPNLGHARFGRRIAMALPAPLDTADQFDPRRVRFADLDGSGPGDLLYLGRDGVRLYANQAGNAFAAAVTVRSLPPVDPLTSVTVTDLLGRGTSCLVWSSSLPGALARPLAYVDLMGGHKPHVLVSVVNNLGAETRLGYAPSTKFYLADQAAGRPWLTRLPFPVHAVERVERIDHIARSTLVTRFAYHHGFYDGHEREFHGFACVEQWDAESFAAGELDLPPVRTVSWFHTGAWLEHEPLALALAREYYRGDPGAPELTGTRLPAGLTVREEREAARALRGKLLRQEVYAEDGTPAAAHPYTVAQHDHVVRVVRRAEGAGHAIFFTHAGATVTLHHERRPDDPRVQHELVLAVDEFGNVTRSAAIAYPRRAPVEPEQARLWATITEARVVNRAVDRDRHRIGVPIETITSELVGLRAPARGLVSRDAVEAAVRRTIEHERHRYHRDDLGGPLPLGEIGARALPHEIYKLALTPDVVAAVYGARVDDAILAEAGYVRDELGWWAPSGHAEHDPARFFLPIASIDPFGERHLVRHDAHALLPVEVVDPLGNRTAAVNDYRVLAPALVTDPNRNQTAAAFDALGLVIATAAMGKDGEGDTLDDPTSRLDYDLDRWRRIGQPAAVRTRARERHRAANTRWQESVAYTDGAGRAVMTKTRAAGGRWIGSGRTVFDNKGNPVKQYEPFFSATAEFEDERAIVEWGVTPILRHDPLGRLIRTDHPDGTHERVDFDAWRQETWDRNDAIAETAWLARMQAGTAAERRCAALALAHAGTPAVAHLDALGRTFLTVADNGAAGRQPTRVELDIEGNQRAVTDARGNRIVRQAFDLLGHPIHVVRADASPVGARTLIDAAAQPLRTWSERGFATRIEHDALRRPIARRVRPPDGAELVAERTVYGEAHPEAEARNLRTRPYQVFDGAGVLTSERYDLHGNPIDHARRLAADFRAVPDWGASPPLEAESFRTTAVFDALERVVARTTPDGSETRLGYDDGGHLERVDVRVRGAAAATSFVAGITYNPRGQRAAIAYGNGVTTDYTYDDLTFRLTRLRSTRASDGAAVQDLGYQHDPVGNIVAITDAVSFGAPISADGRYEYDALYQLVLAEGREHPGQQPTDEDAALVDLPPGAHPADWQALRRYRETYAYDAVGNLERLHHEALGGDTWTRRQAYAPDCNRLLRTSLPGDADAQLSATYDHDDAGNLTRMPHLPALAWDHADRLVAVRKQVGGSTNQVHFTYDAAGQRVRKVYAHGAVLDERIYLDGHELHRRRNAATGAVELERQTLHVMDDRRRIALVETKTVDAGLAPFTPAPRLRFQLENHLGSASLELDAAGAVIGYEEYHPFGTTSFRAADASAEVSPRRYRYTGKERDDETGLYYHGARYYAPWLARWMSIDPVDDGRGRSRYAYVNNKPISWVDPAGRYEEPVHGWLTYQFAMLAGFTQKEAATLALATAAPDHDPKREPLSVTNMAAGRVRDIHFPDQKTALARYDKASKQGGSLQALGSALHTLQDVGFKEAWGPHVGPPGARERTDRALLVAPTVVSASVTPLTGPKVAVSLDAALTYTLYGIGHPTYVTEAGNLSLPTNKYADRAYENPVANTKALTMIFDKVVEAAKARGKTPVTNAKALAGEAIRDVVTATTEGQIDALLGRQKNSAGQRCESYMGIVDNGTAYGVDPTYAWEKEKIDRTANPDPEPPGALERGYMWLDRGIREIYGIPSGW